MVLRVAEKTGYVTASKEVVIYRFGMPFYRKTAKGGDKITFNLPAGIYDVKSGFLIKLDNPIVYKKIELPPPNNPTSFPGKIKIKFIDNPNKCSVDLSGKYETLFLFDHSFKNFPKFVLTWICGHELGHYLYRGDGQVSEKNCDNYSANLMLDIGYNPSQIDAAIELALSSGAIAKDRKKHLYTNLKKI